MIFIDRPRPYPSVFTKELIAHPKEWGNLLWQIPKNRQDKLKPKLALHRFNLLMINLDNGNFERDNATNLTWVAWMSFFWSVSSLMVFSVLPAFLVDELKMGHSHIGFVEGLAISSSFLSKFFAGFLSDVFKQRKPLIMVGTILSLLTKPLFALCTSAGLMFGLRFTDRLSKGIRSAPTDALIADLSSSHLYASNFGMRQALYTLGDVVGAVVAMIIMLWSHNNYRFQCLRCPLFQRWFRYLCCGF